MKPKRSTPQEVAKEIQDQLPAESVYLQAKTGKVGTLDLRELALASIIRLGDCGRFPRGKVTLAWKDGSTLDLGAHQCNHRLCPRCGRRRGYRLAADMAGALRLIEGWGWTPDRTRFATLTIENVEDADDGISRIMLAWHRTLATKTWGRLICGGFRAVEIKPGKDGKWNVHLHAILYLWTPDVPYKLIRDAWDKAAEGHFNQRFDALRNKARPHPGESKAAAAARYLVKYLVKHEELKGSRRMPGGIAHLLGAIEGRRLFGAWGVGAAALRIERHERPRWTAAWDRHLTGYHHEGLPPETATLETPWGTREAIEIPIPPLPSAFRREDVPEQAEPKGGPWTVRRVYAANPLTVHPWEDIPRPKGRTAISMKTAFEDWIENPASRGPVPFRWRPWYAAARKEWTDDATVILGERGTTQGLGAALWSRVEAPDERYPDPSHPEHIAHQLLAAHAQAIRSARRGLVSACTPLARGAYLARLPDSIRKHLEETCQYQPDPGPGPVLLHREIPPPARPGVRTQPKSFPRPFPPMAGS